MKGVHNWVEIDDSTRGLGIFDKEQDTPPTLHFMS